MLPKLTPAQRLKAVERVVLNGESPSFVAKELGISRTLLYRWINRYSKDGRRNTKILSLKPKLKTANSNGAIPEDKIRIVLDIVRKNPEWSVGKIVENLPKDKNNKPIIGHHGVQNLLFRLNLNTAEKRESFANQPQKQQYPPSVYRGNGLELNAIGSKSVENKIIVDLGEEIRPQDRLAIIERVKNGESVSGVCDMYGISRTIYYRWLKRYEAASEGHKLEALWDRKPIISKYFNQAPEEYAQAVLSAVIKYPELSSHKIVHVLPHVGGKPILGNHGVQNVLRRNNLTTYEKRLIYSRENSKAAYAGGFIHFWQNALSFLLNRTPNIRKILVSSTLVSILAIFSVIAVWGATSFARFLGQAPSLTFSIGILFSIVALATGMFFFIYALKYYFTIGIVLSFSRKVEQGQDEREERSIWSRILAVNNRVESQKIEAKQRQFSIGPGLFPDVSEIELDRQPFISVHVALYNEKRVVERLLTALTAFDYENYEVIIADDSTDETKDILSNNWKDHPRVKILHRDTREGFKGGALRLALEATDQRAEFITIFDADFIPYPDTLTQFLKYFKVSCGSLKEDVISKTNIAAVQGYQWHVLNKSENWVTRGVRSEYAGSYVLERSGIEIYGGLKQIAGSVYMIRADVIKKLGWGKSITEDFQLTLKLYEQGYKVVYTPYVQAPAEAVSTIKRLIRQRMRWAEGHSFNVKRMFKRLLIGNWVNKEDPILGKISNSKYPIWVRNSKSDRVWVKSPLSLAEKFEVVYLSPYYLQAFLFMFGTFCWLMAEAVFKVRLPFWTEVWGWSLILTNLLALPLMNLVALFLEEAEEKDYLGLFSFVILSYVVAPFQAYAAVKGFTEQEEGPWFRTPKTGRITDVFTPGHFYRYIRGIFGKQTFSEREEGVGFAPAGVAGQHQIINYHLLNKSNPYLALTSSHNRFNEFGITKREKLPWIARATLSILLIFTTTLLFLSQRVQFTYATDMAGPLKLSDGPANAVGEAWPTGANFLQNTASYASVTTNFLFNSVANFLWYTNFLPTGNDDNNAIIPAGQYNLEFAKLSGPPASNTINYAIQLLLTDASGANPIVLLTSSTFYVNSGAGTVISANNTIGPHSIGSIASNISIPASAKKRLGVRFWYVSGSHATRSRMNILINNAALPARLVIPANIQVPEIPHKVIFYSVMILSAMIPYLASPVVINSKRRKKKKGWKEDISDLLGRLTGRKYLLLDKLPV